MEMTVILAMVCVMIPMVIGDVVSAKTKAFVPSVFVTALVFLFAFWYVIPKDTITIATLSQPVAGLMMYILITHMGTLMNIKELMAQWKTVVISLAGIAGILLSLMTVGIMVLGKETAIVGAPPLTGGIVAAILMKEAALNANLPDLAVLAILVYVVQGFAGYPLTAIFLKKEGTRLLEGYRKGERENIKVNENMGDKKTLIPALPEKYNTTYMILFKLSFVAFLADISTKSLNNYVFHNPSAISPMVTCLVFGVIFTEIGFLDRSALNKAGSFGWAMTVLMAFIFEGLSQATPEMLSKVAVPLLGVVVIGVIGMTIFAYVAGKALKESKYMALPIAYNALYGFPPNYILTKEAINALTEDESEREYLTDIMMPKMIIGGFTSVTIASVIIGGIFVGML